MIAVADWLRDEAAERDRKADQLGALPLTQQGYQYAATVLRDLADRVDPKQQGD